MCSCYTGGEDSAAWTLPLWEGRAQRWHPRPQAGRGARLASKLAPAGLPWRGLGSVPPAWGGEAWPGSCHVPSTHVGWARKTSTCVTGGESEGRSRSD